MALRKVPQKHEDVVWKLGIHLSIAGAILILIRSIFEWRYLPFPVSIQAIFAMIPSALICGRGPNVCWVSLNVLMLIISVPVFGYLTLFLSKKVRKDGRISALLHSLTNPLTYYFVFSGVVLSMLIVLVSINNEYYFQNNELVQLITLPGNIISIPFILFGVCGLWTNCAIARPFGDMVMLIVFALLGLVVSKLILRFRIK